MLSLNSVQLIGNLGRDAEVRVLTSGDHTVANFTVATTYSYKKDGNWVNDTTWHRCIVFNPSDFVRASLVKGMPVYVQGRIQVRKFTNKDGEEVTMTEIVAEKIIPLSKVEVTDRAEAEDTREEEAPDPFAKKVDDTNDDLPF